MAVNTSLGKYWSPFYSKISATICIMYCLLLFPSILIPFFFLRMYFQSFSVPLAADCGFTGRRHAQLMSQWRHSTAPGRSIQHDPHSPDVKGWISCFGLNHSNRTKSSNLTTDNHAIDSASLQTCPAINESPMRRRLIREARWPIVHVYVHLCVCILRNAFSQSHGITLTLAVADSYMAPEYA